MNMDGHLCFNRSGAEMNVNAIRVLLADDSAVTRRLLSEAMATDPELEIVGTARHGGEVVPMLPEHRPDVILLDVEMPVMDGVETVVAIRATDSQVPIVMFSSITTSGGEATLDALAAGANDYTAKPVKLGHATDAIAYIRSELIPKVKMWGRRHRIRRSGTKPLLTHTSPTQSTSTMTKLPPPRVNPTPKPKFSLCRTDVIEIVAIGISTGGPNALAEVLAHIGAHFPVPIVIVQHMPAVFTQLLAARLDAICPLNVREGISGAVLTPGDVWLAPGNYHMMVRNQKSDRVLEITQGPLENSCRPAVDPLFRSVAAAYGAHALGVVMTGMGRDGEDGCRAIQLSGGQIIAQDEASSTVWGMPRAVIQSGLANEVLPLSLLAHALIDRTQQAAIQKMAESTLT